MKKEFILIRNYNAFQKSYSKNIFRNINQNIEVCFINFFLLLVNTSVGIGKLYGICFF